MSKSGEDLHALNILDVLKATLRHWLFIPAMLALGVLAGLAILAIFEPSYQTTAKILLERRDVPFKGGSEPAAETAVVIDERYVEGQVEVIGSDDFARAVVAKLKLADQVKTLKPPGFLKQLLISWGFANDKSKLTAEQAAVAEVMDDVTVFATPTSNVISVRVTGSGAQYSADLANAIARNYVDSVTGDDSPTQSRVRDWLSSQIAELRKKVADSEAASERFRSNAGLLKGTNSTLGTEQISAINAQLSLAEAAESEAVAKSKAIKSLLAQRGSVDSASEVLNSAVIQQLQQQRIAANRLVSELSATYLGGHPKLIAAKQQINEIDKQIRREALKIVEGLESQAQLATARTKSLRNSLEELKKSESAANLEDVQLKALEREATANRQLLETLLARYVEINTRQDLDVKPTSARIIQEAVVPAFVHFPRKGPILFLTTLGGLILGLGLAFFYEIARAAGDDSRTAFRPDRGRRSVVIGEAAELPRPAAPTASAAPPAVMPGVAATPFRPDPSTAYPAVVTQVLNRSAPPSLGSTETVAPRSDVRVDTASAEDETIATELLRFHKKGVAANIAFTRVGCGPMESALAVAGAARDLAKLGHRCLVIDLDMERAELERLFELADGPGLLDLLAGQSDFDRLISRDASSTVQIIRLGDPANKPENGLLVSRVNSILKSLNGIYDFILVHAGQSSSDAKSIVQLADAAVFVSPPSHDSETISAMHQLRETSAIEVINLSVEESRVSEHMA